MIGQHPSTLVSIILLAATFVIVVILDRIGKNKILKKVTTFGVVLALISLGFFPGSGSSVPIMKFDLFTLFFSLIFTSLTLAVVLSSREKTAAYYASLLLSTLGMILASAANDLILVFISIELVTSPSYILVAYKKTQQRIEAGTKYFIVNIVASALLLLGLALLAADSGTTSLSALSVTGGPFFLIGLGAVIAGLGFKLGIFPFNFWIPDVYQGAPSEISGFLAGASKKAGFAAFLRIAAVVSLSLHSWTLIIAVFSALSMTIPNVIALLQENVRRLLSFSIMTHAGFLLMGVAVMTPLGISGTLFHSFAHAFSAFGAFLVLGVLFKNRIENMQQLRGMGWRNPFLALSLTVFLLSLTGIPILSGFASKFYLFYATAKGGLLWLTLLAILNSVISLYYYFRIIRAMYGYKTAGRTYVVPRSILVVIAFCLLVTIVFGIYPQPMIDLAASAAVAIF